MNKEWSDKLLNRFLHYVKVDTQSQPGIEEIPSTQKQWDLARYLKNEMESIGLEDVSIDEHAYVMGYVPSNCNTDSPTIGFIAHFDTSPDFTGTDVKPQIHKNYNGKDIVLNKEKNIILSPEEFNQLEDFVGQTLITTDGTTLLGADDKAGIAEIMTAAEYLIENPDIKHPRIAIGFTPDEEVGKGAHLFDVKKFGADWAYTMDGSTVGELEYANFNAASAVVHFQGKIVHPGSAKNRMINAIHLYRLFAEGLPQDQVPEKTDGEEGFFHQHTLNASTDFATLELIIRDHNKEKFEDKKALILSLVKDLNTQLGKELVTVVIKDQYFNMYEKIKDKMHIVALAETAMKNLAIEPIIKPIRGGTDGSQLSFMGLPCPNIFAGGQNFHSRYEFTSLQAMEKATEVIVEITKLAVNHNK